MVNELIAVQVKYEQDIVLARQRAREIARELGCDGMDQVRVASSVSEIARLLSRDQMQATVRFLIERSPEPQLAIRASCGLQGTSLPLDPDADEFVAARRTVDSFVAERRGGEFVVTLRKRLPPTAITEGTLSALRAKLTRSEPKNPYQEFQAQNQELLQTLADLRRSQSELAEVNRELAETNRGVVALYAELEEKAESLRIAAEEKSRFYSGISHELRTPVHSILSLARILLDRLDGELNDEQQKQVTLIRGSAQNLAEWIDDLLDLAKAEAGRLTLTASHFTAEDLLGALRGVVRPIQSNVDVDLIFDDASSVPALVTDEGKLTQILRNFVVNSIKFTEIGEIRVRAEVVPDGSDRVRFSVRDTGVGIATKDQERIFEEFVQIDGPLQRKSKGTGLGLPLSKRLAALLGGTIEVVSEVGVGSEFAVVVPRVFIDAMDRFEPAFDEPAAADTEILANASVLVVDDDESARYVIRAELLALQCGLKVLEASSGAEGLLSAARDTPDLILLDWNMPEIDGAEVLRGLRAGNETGNLLAIVCTSYSLTNNELAWIEEQDASVIEKPSGSRASWRESLMTEYRRLRSRFPKREAETTP